MTQGEAARFVESFLRDVGEITDVEGKELPGVAALSDKT